MIWTSLSSTEKVSVTQCISVRKPPALPPHREDVLRTPPEDEEAAAEAAERTVQIGEGLLEEAPAVGADAGSAPVLGVEDEDGAEDQGVRVLPGE